MGGYLPQSDKPLIETLKLLLKKKKLKLSLSQIMIRLQCVRRNLCLSESPIERFLQGNKISVNIYHLNCINEDCCL